MSLALSPRLASAVLMVVMLTAAAVCLAESKSMEIENLDWQTGQLLPTYCEIPIELGAPAASIQGITLKVMGQPKEGTMVLCKGGCDTFPCHQTLRAYFPEFRLINAWTPLESPDPSFEFLVPLQYSTCYPDCGHPCAGKDAAGENWAFLKDDGNATLRLELQGDIDGCGTGCLAENGIQRVTVTVEYTPFSGPVPAFWGSMKAVYR